MANIAFAGKKVSKEDIKKELMSILAEHWEGAFTVNFWADDGGDHVQAVVEYEDTSKQLPESFVKHIPLRHMGWRVVILKVPIGYLA